VVQVVVCVPCAVQCTTGACRVEPQHYKSFNDEFLPISGAECNFGKRMLPEDGPGGPKHVAANVEMF
jgi:hypothetical protein